MLTGTSFMRNLHVHKMSDSIGSLDLEFFSTVIDGLVEALRALGRMLMTAIIQRKQTSR